MGAPDLPLAGLTVVVTRAREQAAALSARLEALGAEVIEFATIEIRPAEDYRALDAALADLSLYDWLIFTSANAVKFFRERLELRDRDLGKFRGRVCAIGPATRRAVERLGLAVDLMPEEYVAESLVAAFAGHDLAGKRILLPRAAVARDLAPVELTKRGARVDVVEAYRTAVPRDTAERVREIFFGERKPDWITFTSSSTVANFVNAAGSHTLEGVRIASIGPVTSATARQYGLEVTAEASPYTIEGLVAGILSRR
ncbi:MAG: uroporphyrinogen-III synthase [Bryobacterales bacterium]|jgi:uroporphyrinogen III methyltransferase/synthase|nr:uroporphyrinogen-III synthase [Bryobacterales bacterium]